MGGKKKEGGDKELHTVLGLTKNKGNSELHEIIRGWTWTIRIKKLEKEYKVKKTEKVK